MSVSVRALIGALLFSAACSRTPQQAAPAPVQVPAAPAKPAAASYTVTCPPRGTFGPKSGYNSQFYEDYTLAFVFKDVARGAYVDVGANDPDRGSVTKYFYERGWRGINIEPNPDLVAKLKAARPEDVNLGIGIADKPGVLTFYRFPSESALSTFDAAVAREHKAKRKFDYDTMKIEVQTLTAVLAEHPLGDVGASFLNVDVEGFERQVLSGIDLRRHPVSVVMAESTAPMTEDATFQSWESLLDGAGYLFGMDDGLNRYYVSPERQDLLRRFVDADYCVAQDKLAKGIRLNGYRPQQ